MPICFSDEGSFLSICTVKKKKKKKRWIGFFVTLDIKQHKARIVLSGAWMGSAQYTVTVY